MGQILACDDKIHVSDRTELIVIACGTVVDNFEFEFRMLLLIPLAPSLKVSRKFVVCDHVNRFQIRNSDQVVDDPFDNRFATNHK